MGDSGVVARLGNMKALLGIVAGAGASYGLYKLISREGKRRNKKKAANETVKSSQQEEVKVQPGSLLAKVSGLDVVCFRPGEAVAGKQPFILSEKTLWLAVFDIFNKIIFLKL